MKNEGLRDKLYEAADRFELWDLGGLGLPSVQLYGDRCIVVEEYSAISEYSENRIKVEAGPMSLVIEGMDFEIKYMEKGGLGIKGIISSVTCVR